MVMKPQPLNDRDFEILRALATRQDRAEAVRFLGGATPFQIGGSICSDHSQRLRKMALKGVVRTELRRGNKVRGSRRYWITNTGRAALAEWLRSRDGDVPVD